MISCAYGIGMGLVLYGITGLKLRKNIKRIFKLRSPLWELYIKAGMALFLGFATFFIRMVKRATPAPLPRRLHAVRSCDCDPAGGRTATVAGNAAQLLTAQRARVTCLAGAQFRAETEHRGADQGDDRAAALVPHLGRRCHQLPQVQARR